MNNLINLWSHSQSAINAFYLKLIFHKLILQRRQYLRRHISPYSYRKKRICLLHIWASSPPLIPRADNSLREAGNSPRRRGNRLGDSDSKLRWWWVLEKGELPYTPLLVLLFISICLPIDQYLSDKSDMGEDIYTLEEHICLHWTFGFHSELAVVCFCIWEPGFDYDFLCWQFRPLLCFSLFLPVFIWMAGSINV